MTNAAKRRQQMLTELTEVVAACNCDWPLQTFRNGSGHSPSCPADWIIRQRRKASEGGG